VPYKTPKREGNLHENLHRKLKELRAKIDKRRRKSTMTDHSQFDQDLRQFANKVGIICGLEAGGKVPPLDAYKQVKKLFKKLKKSRKEMLQESAEIEEMCRDFGIAESLREVGPCLKLEELVTPEQQAKEDQLWDTIIDLVVFSEESIVTIDDGMRVCEEYFKEFPDQRPPNLLEWVTQIFEAINGPKPQQ